MPFPAGGFLPDTASCTCSKEQTWFKCHALDKLTNNKIKRIRNLTKQQNSNINRFFVFCNGKKKLICYKNPNLSWPVSQFFKIMRHLFIYSSNFIWESENKPAILDTIKLGHFVDTEQTVLKPGHEDVRLFVVCRRCQTNVLWLVETFEVMPESKKIFLFRSVFLIITHMQWSLVKHNAILWKQSQHIMMKNHLTTRLK